MNCPHCDKRIPTKLITKEAAILSAEKRKTHGGGRPLSDAPRCACGKMTARLAEIKHHKCPEQK